MPSTEEKRFVATYNDGPMTITPGQRSVPLLHVEDFDTLVEAVEWLRSERRNHGQLYMPMIRDEVDGIDYHQHLVISMLDEA